MSVHETVNHGSRREVGPSTEVMGNYPYDNLSVSGMARVLSERIERHQQAKAESASASELSDTLELPEAEAA